MFPLIDDSEPKAAPNTSDLGFEAAFSWDTVSIMPGDLERLQRLAKAVLERRRALALTRAEVHGNGGPADTTMARIENPDAQTTEPRPTTLRRLDKGLQWPEGTAAKMLHGGTSSSGAPVDNETLELTDALSFTTIEMPVAIVRDIVRAADGAIGSPSPDTHEALRRCVQRLTAIYATEVLERVGGPGATIAPAIELTFRAHLNSPLAPAGDPARVDQLYRRWLAGMLPEDEKGLIDAFTARWRAKRRSIMLRQEND